MPFTTTETFTETFSPSELHMKNEGMVLNLKPLSILKLLFYFYFISEYLINQIKLNLHHVWVYLIDITVLLFIITMM